MSNFGDKVSCDGCKKFATLKNAVALGWTWFRGFNDHTTHLCAQCQRRIGKDGIEAMITKSRQKPSNVEFSGGRCEG